jgi:hypothetical protein
MNSIQSQNFIVHCDEIENSILEREDQNYLLIECIKNNDLDHFKYLIDNNFWYSQSEIIPIVYAVNPNNPGENMFIRYLEEKGHFDTIDKLIDYHCEYHIKL